MTKRIIKVSSLDEQPDCISIELANGSIILLDLDIKKTDPLFAQIKDLSKPNTDGEKIFWLNGASLSLDEILELLESDSSNDFIVRKDEKQT